MDKTTVKLILESYRPQDAGDPIFAEALREVAGDLELAAWFEDMQRFDAVMTSKFRELLVPPEVKNHILLGFHAIDPGKRRYRHSRVVWISAIAAVFIVGLVCWNFFVPRPNPANALAKEAISYTEKMPALQFVCFDASRVAEWVNEQPGAQKVGLHLPRPAEKMSMSMIGASMADWNGKPVVMICLQNGEQMAMLYILKPENFKGLERAKTQTIQEGNWIVQAKNSNGYTQLLTTKGNAEDLDFQSPF